MARGGLRPGGGRPRLTDAEKAERAEARKLARRAAAKAKVAPKKKAAKTKAKSKGYSATGKKSADAPSDWPFGTQESAPPPPAAPPVSADDNVVIPGGEPLEFLQAIIDETRLNLPIRMQAAALAVGYKHAKPAPVGKKEAKSAAAKKTVSRFAPSAPPKLVAAAGKKV